MSLFDSSDYALVSDEVHILRRKNSYCYILFALLLGCTLTLMSAKSKAEMSDDMYITDAQPLLIIEQAAQTAASDGYSLTFSAYSKTFKLNLEENQRLLSRMETLLPKSGVTIYKGSIQGIEGSWARITRSNGQISGAIFDGEEMYLIDSAAAAGAAMDAVTQKSLNDAGATTVIFRASDIMSANACSVGEDGSQAFSYDELVSDLQQIDDVALNAAEQSIDLAIVADREFVAISNGDPQGRVLSQMNIIDGIYDEQVGVKLNIVSIDALSDNGNLTATDGGQLLNQFRAFVGNNNPGVAHLFSGKQFDGNVLGVAFLQGICTVNGVGVSQAGGRGITGSLVVAHELGHNFGAPHDNQNGSACVGTAGDFLMNPFINGSQEFSQCSLDQISQVVARRNCLSPINNDGGGDDDNDDGGDDNEPAPISCNFAVDFSDGDQDFAFVADQQTPQYTIGSLANGALTIDVGGVDDADVNNMLGAFERECNSDEAATATISIRKSLTQSADYESNEVSQLALRVNGQQVRVFDAITGNGNGGGVLSTGVQTETTTVNLRQGNNTLELICFNNRKTLQNEVTQCQFFAMESVLGGGDDDDNDNDNALVNENFEGSQGGFEFEAADFTEGNLINNGGVGNSGALQVLVGGINDADVTNMVGNWTRTITTSGPVNLSVQAEVVQSSEYEQDEVSQAAVIVDGNINIISTVRGDGNGGNDRSTGFRTFNLPLNLEDGDHTISLSCFNNKKTLRDEITRCRFDNLIIQ